MQTTDQITHFDKKNWCDETIRRELLSVDSAFCQYFIPA